MARERVSLRATKDSLYLNHARIVGNRKVLEAHAAADTLTHEESGSVHTNLGATGSIALTLPQNAQAGCFFTFMVMAAQELAIDPGAAGALYVNGAKQTDDYFASADDEGEFMLAVADGNGDWVCSVIGTWTVQT